MPLFEYICEECGETFEKLVRGSTTTILCPSCESANVRKKLSTFASRISGGTSASTSSSSAGAACAPGGL
jgi:putative FmdB family regulatory protein